MLLKNITHIMKTFRAHLSHFFLLNKVELRKTKNAAMGNGKFVEQLKNSTSLFPFSRKLVVDCQKTKEQRPFALDFVKNSQLPWLVVKSASVFAKGLVAIP